LAKPLYQLLKNNVQFNFGEYQINAFETIKSKRMHEKGKNWDGSLSQVQFAINNTFNRSIKNTPSMLLFGMNQHGETRDYLRKVYRQKILMVKARDEI